MAGASTRESEFLNGTIGRQADSLGITHCGWSVLSYGTILNEFPRKSTVYGREISLT